MKRTISFLLVLLMVLLTTCTVLAAGARTKTATLTFNDIKVTLDGKEIEFKDSNEPFVIDGTTYLPIRAIADVLGLEVGWDAKTSTVVLTSDSSTATKGSATLSDATTATKASGTTFTTPDAITYVLNTNTKKFHYSSCSSASKIKSSNKQTYTGTRDELIAKGYSPCKNCHP